MAPYESVYTGQFIFMLGHLSAARGLDPGGNSVALLAQNPGDQMIGDVVTSWGGVTSIIEFKRGEDAVQSEFRKPAKKELLDRFKDATRARSLALSRKGHFLAFGRGRGRLANIHVLRYADIKASPHQDAATWSMRVFLDQILAHEVGLDPTELRDYVPDLQESHKKATGDGSTPKAISSLIVNLD